MASVTQLCETNLELALPYLERRGISEEVARAARLGVVADTPGLTHVEKFMGRLVIPYVTKAGVLNLKFRTMTQQDPKYLCLPNSQPLLYGTTAFFEAGNAIGICEGELDALIISHNVLPAVGCPGVSTWQKHHPRCFQGYERVYVFADGDGPGQEMAKRISKDLEQAVVVQMPDGMDVNDVFLNEGAEGLRKRAGVE